MRIDRGDRITYLFWGCPFVIKVPKIKYEQFYKELKYFLKEKDYKGLFSAISEDVYEYGSMKSCLFYGFVKNMNEARFYRANKLSILVPTYFSVFGVMNFQKKVHDYQLLDLTSIKFFAKISKLVKLGNPVVRYLFKDVYNFAFIDYLQVIDYGDLEVQRFLLKSGDYPVKHFQK